MDNLETNAKILEQCRLDMDNLAGLGASGMDEAVSKAEKWARTCSQELRQAAKAVELTARQKKTVEDARLAGEEKLSAAVQDEEDARIAAETVKRMIEDAASVRGSSNKDTAKILERAEAVLDETLNRADQFYTEKKAQREEIEHAMLRLYATEKAVFYTMAKAERNEGEKLLNKILAEKKHEVCSAEYEVLLLKAKAAELQEKADSHQENLQHLESEMVLANAQVEEGLKAQKKAAEDFNQQLQASADECSATLRLLSGEQAQCQERCFTAETELQVAKGLLEDCQAEEMDRRESLAQMQIQSRDTIADARKQYEQAIAEQDRQLMVYEEAVKHSRATLEDAIAKHEVAVGEADRLRNLAEEFAVKAAEAEAEEISAREAAATANRLAENAIKIRESISSESSQLLYHAQEVLMEAAASAQQLMDEKSLMRAAAQNESDRISKQAALAENTVRQAEELVEIKKSACQESDIQLEQAGLAAEAKKAELLSKMEQQIAAAEELLRGAQLSTEQAARNVVEAIDQRDKAQFCLDELTQELADITQRLEAARVAGEESRKELQNRADQENARLEEEHRLAIAKATELEEKRDQEQELFDGLQENISDVLAQIDTASAQVQGIISAGVEAIQEAEAEVQRLCEEEQEAHLLAEEAVAKMSSVNQQLLESVETTSLRNLADLIVEQEPVQSDEEALIANIEDVLPTDSAPQAGVEEEKENAVEAKEEIAKVEIAAEELSAAPSVEFLPDESWMDQAAFFLPSLEESPAEMLLPEEEPALIFESPAANPEDEEEAPLIPDTEEEIVAAALPAEETPVPETAEALAADEQSILAVESIENEASEEALISEEDLEEKPLIPDEEPLIIEKPVFSFVDSLLASETDDGPEISVAPPAPHAVVQPAPLAETPALNQEEEPLIPEEDSVEDEKLPERPAEPEVDEVAQAVMKAVSEAAARMTPMEDGDQPYDAKKLTAELSPMLKQDMERTGSWQRQEMTKEELEYTMHLEDVSARLLEHTIIPLEEENNAPHLYQPSDWLANLTRSLGEDAPEQEAAGQAAAKSPKSEIDLEQLLNKQNGGEGAATVPDGQIKMPELELPPMDEGRRWKRQEEEKVVSPKKRRFLFFN